VSESSEWMELEGLLGFEELGEVEKESLPKEPWKSE